MEMRRELWISSQRIYIYTHTMHNGRLTAIWSVSKKKQKYKNKSTFSLKDENDGGKYLALFLQCPIIRYASFRFHFSFPLVSRRGTQYTMYGVWDMGIEYRYRYIVSGKLIGWQSTYRYVCQLNRKSIVIYMEIVRALNIYRKIDGMCFCSFSVPYNHPHLMSEEVASFIVGPSG